MSRFVAGFVTILYVCVVSGQEQTDPIRLKGTPRDKSIAIDVISGGNYPDGAFSIGYGNSNENENERPGADYGVNVNGYPNNNGHAIPNNEYGRGQNEGGYVNGNNDIGDGRNGQNTGFNNIDKGLQNPGQKANNPYDDNYNRETTETPVKNSASRSRLYSIVNYLSSWFY